MLQKHSITLASAVVCLPVMHSAHEYMLMRNAIICACSNAGEAEWCDGQLQRV
jgi:hypothetical protein